MSVRTRARFFLLSYYKGSLMLVLYSFVCLLIKTLYNCILLCEL